MASDVFAATAMSRNPAREIDEQGEQALHVVLNQRGEVRLRGGDRDRGHGRRPDLVLLRERRDDAHRRHEGDGLVAADMNPVTAVGAPW